MGFNLAFKGLIEMPVISKYITTLSKYV